MVMKTSNSYTTTARRLSTPPTAPMNCAEFHHTVCNRVAEERSQGAAFTTHRPTAPLETNGSGAGVLATAFDPNELVNGREICFRVGDDLDSPARFLGGVFGQRLV